MKLNMIRLTPKFNVNSIREDAQYLVKIENRNGFEYFIFSKIVEFKLYQEFVKTSTDPLFKVWLLKLPKH